MSICMIILRDVVAVGVEQLLGDGLRVFKRFFNPCCTGFNDPFQALGWAEREARPNRSRDNGLPSGPS